MVALLNEKREVAEALVAADQYVGRVKPDEAAVKAYYESNLAEFKVPERVRAEFLVLSAEELGKVEAPSEAELKEAYDRLATQLGVAERPVAARLAAPVVLLAGVPGVVVACGVVVQRRVVVLQHQRVVGPPRDDLRGAGGLAAQRVDGHRRAGEVERA